MGYGVGVGVVESRVNRIEWALQSSANMLPRLLLGRKWTSYLHPAISSYSRAIVAGLGGRRDQDGLHHQRSAGRAC